MKKRPDPRAERARKGDEGRAREGGRERAGGRGEGPAREGGEARAREELARRKHESTIQLLFRASRSDQPAAGGIADRLMVVSVTVWDDADSSGTWNGKERQITLATKLARVVSYEYEAQGN